MGFYGVFLVFFLVGCFLVGWLVGWLVVGWLVGFWLVGVFGLVFGRLVVVGCGCMVGGWF